MTDTPVPAPTPEEVTKVQGEGASAEVAMMWDPVASPRFG